ncbi:MAG: HIT domain-containing protein [Anaerolineaceae bacterium]
MSDILPINRLAETQTLIAFFHPKPAYPFHVLIVPKSDLDSVMAIDSAHTPFLSDCFTTIQKLVKQYDLISSGYRIIVNGGKNQEFPILHFHLVSEEKRKVRDS